MACPLVAPEDVGAEDTQVVPLLVKTLPEVPDVVRFVPPYATLTVEPCQVPEATVPKGLTLPEASRFTDLVAG